MSQHNQHFAIITNDAGNSDLRAIVPSAMVHKVATEIQQWYDRVKPYVDVDYYAVDVRGDKVPTMDDLMPVESFDEVNEFEYLMELI